MSTYDQLQAKAHDALTLVSLRALLPKLTTQVLFLNINGFPFSNPRSYAIFGKGPRESSDYFVLRAVWRSDLDTPKNPLDEVKLAIQLNDPTIELQTAECDREWILPIIQRFKNLSLPIAPVQRMGLDGEFRELWIGDLFGSMSLRWWSSGPEEWRPATNLVREMLHEIESDRLKFAVGPLAFSYSVDLIWKEPGAQTVDMEGIRVLLPKLANRPLVQLLTEIIGSTRIHVGVFNKNDAINKCKMAEEFGLTAVISRNKVPQDV